MSRATSMRFPDDVLKPMQAIAAEKKTKLSKVAMELLREALKQRTTSAVVGSAREAERLPVESERLDVVSNGGGKVSLPEVVRMTKAGMLTIEEQKQPTADGHFVECPHGRNEFRCLMLACRIKTGRG